MRSGNSDNTSGMFWVMRSQQSLSTLLKLNGFFSAAIITYYYIIHNIIVEYNIL
jgi:hypothetical protein